MGISIQLEAYFDLLHRCPRPRIAGPSRHTLKISFEIPFDIEVGRYIQYEQPAGWNQKYPDWYRHPELHHKM